jgi:hypothetical protein
MRGLSRPLQEISAIDGMRGGPGRTRTSNQTVMSGLADLGNSDKSDVFRHVRSRLFASVHGVSVVNLWSVHAFPNVNQSRAPCPRPASAKAAVGAPLQETLAMFEGSPRYNLTSSRDGWSRSWPI